MSIELSMLYTLWIIYILFAKKFKKLILQLLTVIPS